MKKITPLIFFFLLFGITTTAQLANWTIGANAAYKNFPVNVSGQINGYGRIVQMKFHATDATKLYAVTAEGGFFTSSNAGTSWAAKQGTENLTGSCASICVDYTNDQVIYLGSGDPSYYSNGSGVYKSTDGGATFTATTLTNCLVIEILQDPSNASTFIAATNKGIYKTINNGLTWTAKTATNIQFCDLKRNAGTNSPILYACTKDNTCRLFRSSDSGETWTQITSGITTSTTFITAGGRVGVTPADPNVVYFEAIGGGGIIHKSTDGGLNFTVMKGQGAGTLANPYLTFYDFDNANTLTGQGNYNNCIVVDATNPAKIWLQSHNTWLSTDSGVTWTEITHWSTKVHTDMHQIQQSPFDSTKLFSCNDGGVWLSTDGGNNWVTKSDGLYAYEIYNNCGKSSNTDKNSISIGTQDNGRLYRNDTGWFTDRGGDDTRQKEYDYLPNGGNYYEKTQTNRKAANGGATTATGFPTTTGNYWEYLAFNRSNINLGFMWFTDNILYRTTNLAAATPTWTNVFTFTAPVMAMHSCIADPNKLYIITNDSKIQVSSNALSATPTFTTFTLPSVTNSIASIAAIANNANKVYISINNKVYSSTDSGATWTNITYNLPSVDHRKILAEEFGGAQELVFIATNNAVYYKKAGQTTWTNYSTNLPGRRAPTNFTMYDDGSNQSALRYYTYGRGVWESPFGNLRAVSSSFDVSQKIYCTTGSGVAFTDYSTGNITSWSWSFPGGTPSTSTLQNPVVTYSSPGLYGATLTVSDGVNSSTYSKGNVFLVMAAPPTVNTGCSISANSNLANGFGIGISSFSLGNISKTSSSNDGQYNDYTCSQWTTLTQGSTYSASITTGTTNAEGAKVYIDLNNNGVFETTEALVSYPSNNTGTRSLSFTVPSTGVVLNTGLRLRIISKFNSIPTTACDVSTYGQAEDYTVYILPIPSAILSNGTGSSTICTGQSANLKVNITGGTSPYTITYSNGTNTQTISNYSSGANISVSPVANTTYSLVTVLDYFGTSIPVSGTASVTISSFTITASAGANGSISPTGATSVNCGTNKTYTITPNSCYQIATVLVDGVNNPTAVSTGTFTFSTISASHTISATFVNNCNTIVNLKLFIEGYYDTSIHAMRPVLINEGVGSSSINVDNITLELRNTSGGLVNSASTLLHTNGSASVTFTNTPSGLYYLVIKHRNAIETWSATPQLINGTTLQYDFSNAITKAYGNNLKLLEPGVYGLFSGDINQDGFIEGLDFVPLFNDSDTLLEGYYNTDLNGDGFVEGLDYPILFNNSDNLIESSHP